MEGFSEKSTLLPVQGRQGQFPGNSRAAAAAAGERARPASRSWRVRPRVSLGLLCAALVGAVLFHVRSPAAIETREESSMNVKTDSVTAAASRNSDSFHGLGHNPLEEESSRWKSDGGGAVVGDGSGGESASVPGEVPPNVIFILMDDVGMNDFGASSTDLAAMTPFMESLGSSGVRITKYYTNHICTPARASLMTGRDTFRTGMQFDEIQSEQPWGLPLNETTLADRFKSIGYATHAVGKWNLGMFQEDYYPYNRGFDTFLGFLGPQETYYSHAWGGYYDFGYGDSDGYVNSTSNTTRMGPDYAGKYSTTLTANRALEVATTHMASGNEDPLFLYLAFQAVHYPLNTPLESLFTPDQLEVLSQVTTESSDRLNFAKILYYLDLTVERMVKGLDAMGMMDNTLLVLTSDNGGCPAYGGSNYPYRGCKHTLFEGGVRVPALVYSKSESIIPLEARGTTYDGMMHVTDWTPTLASTTGIPLADMGQPLSGFDHWSAIIGQTPESELPIRNELVLGRSSYVYDDDSDSMELMHDPRGAYIYDGWKINIGDECKGWHSFSETDNVEFDEKCAADCVTCAGECMYQNSQNNTYMFHLDTDPFEKINLAESMPDKFREMVHRWNGATEDEVASVYASNDVAAFAAWNDYNNWVVAWQ